MIRGVDYVTIEVAGIGNQYHHSLEQCNEMLRSNPIFALFDTTVLRSRRDGYVDVLLKPIDGDKRKFISNLKNIGYEHS